MLWWKYRQFRLAAQKDSAYLVISSLPTNPWTLSRFTAVVVGCVAAILACLLVAFISPSAEKPNNPTHGPVKTAEEAIAIAEECMRNSGYAGEPVKDLWPRWNEILVLLSGRGNPIAMRQSRALFYEAKAVVYEDLGDRWIVGFPARGGGDIGVQVIVGRDGKFFLLHDPPSRMSYFKCKIVPGPTITTVHSHVGSK